MERPEASPALAGADQGSQQAQEAADQARSPSMAPPDSQPVAEESAEGEAGSQELPDVVEELQALRLERQPSSGASSAAAAASTDGGGAGGGLFGEQEADEDAAAVQPAPPLDDSGAASPSHEQQQQQQLAALRSAQAAMQAESGSPAVSPLGQEGQQQQGDGCGADAAAPPAPLSEADLLRACPKHVFVFSTAGKPIYSYRGDEARLAGLMATAEAILSVAHSKGHTLKHVRAGSHVFAFLERPPLCLVGVSALAEPPAVLRMQLVLVHGQIVSLLTATALSALFARNPGYDARNLLGGSEGMLSALVDSFTAAPAALLGAYPSLPLLGGVRQALAAALTTAVKATGAVHGLVVAGSHVAAACPAAGAAPLQQWDVLLLLNLLAANPSFRHSGQAMTPVCLPRFNAAANLHAFIATADADTQTATVLLCGGMPDPGALAEATLQMHQQLEGVGALQALVQCAAAEQQPQSQQQALLARQQSEQQQQLAGGSRRGASRRGSRRGSRGGGRASADLGSSAGSLACGPGGGLALLAVASLPPAAGGGPFGTTPLLHFVYKLSGRQQYVMSPFGQQLLDGGLRQPLIVAYSQLRAAMFEGSSAAAGPLQRLRYEARPRFVLFGSVAADTELYLACDPLTDQAEAAGVAGKLGMWLRSRHDQLFNLL